jgi:hypothetical protein
VVGCGRGRLAPVLIEDQFKTLLIGQDPFDIELLWEQMFRASQFYGRKGAVIAVISGIDLALWDIVGKALGQPVAIEVRRLAGAASQGLANPDHKDNLWVKPLPDPLSIVNNGRVGLSLSSNLNPRPKQPFGALVSTSP